MLDRAAELGWVITRVLVDGEHRGTLARLGNEVHFEVLKSPCITRRTVKETLGPLLQEHDFLTTKTLIIDTVSQRFVERLGFKIQWSDDRYRYYMLTELPFKGK